jgi:putative iron-dependent peroxidase
MQHPHAGQAAQPGILATIPVLGRFLFFDVRPDANPERSLRSLLPAIDGDAVVLGLGLPLVQALRASVPGLPVFPAVSGPGFSVPSTQSAIWCWLRGEDRGELVLQTQTINALLDPDFHMTQVVDAFRFREGRDLSGYEDGTENPVGEAALEAAIVQGAGAGMDGSSFVAVQQWQHDFSAYQRMTGEQQDHCIGRRKSDNEELEEAPASAHVKRTAQESFAPEAFVLRRSMPWADADRAGLMFVAFGKSTIAFAAQLQRMVGAEDGIVDGLFQFTRPLTGSYFWCPPLQAGRLDLSQLGF